MKKIYRSVLSWFLPAAFLPPEGKAFALHAVEAGRATLARFPLALVLCACFIGLSVSHVFGGASVRGAGGFVMLSALWAAAAVYIRGCGVLTPRQGVLITLAGFAALWAGFCNAAPSPVLWFFAIVMAMAAAIAADRRPFTRLRRFAEDALKIFMLLALCVLAYAVFLYAAHQTLDAAGLRPDAIDLRLRTLTALFMPVFWLAMLLLLSALPLPAGEPPEGAAPPKRRAMALAAAGLLLAVWALVDFPAPPDGGKARAPEVEGGIFPHPPAAGEMARPPRLYADNSTVRKVAGYDYLASGLCEELLFIPRPDTPDAPKRAVQQEIQVGAATWTVTCHEYGTVVVSDGREKIHVVFYGELSRMEKEGSGPGENGNEWPSMPIEISGVRARVAMSGLRFIGPDRYGYQVDVLAGAPPPSAAQE